VNFFNIGHKDLPVMTSQEPPPVAS
jgi:hypothetical protein